MTRRTVGPYWRDTARHYAYRARTILLRWLAIALARFAALLLRTSSRMDHQAVREDQTQRIRAQLHQHPISLNVVRDDQPTPHAHVLRVQEQMAWQTRHPSTFPRIVNPS